MSAQANFLPFTSPIDIISPLGITRSNSIHSERLRSGPYGNYHGGNNVLESKSSMANLSRAPSRSGTLNTMPSHASLRPSIPQRSNTLPTPSRPTTPGLAPTALPSRPRTPIIVKKAVSRSPPGGGGHQHERPPLLRRNSPTQSTAQIHTTTSGHAAVHEDMTRDTVKDSMRTKPSRDELLRRVANEVEIIEQEADMEARRILENVRSEKRKRGNSIDDFAPPIGLFIDPSFRSESLSHKLQRRNSLDSAVAVDGGNSPRTAKEWGKWAEDKVRSRRRLDEVWKKEEDTFTEKLIQRTEKHNAEQKEREARKQWHRQAFLEQERQRALREEQDRQRALREEQDCQRLMREEIDRQRALLEEAAEDMRKREYEKEQDRTQERRRREQQELQDALLAEARRQAQLEEDVRKIDEESARLEEEFRTKERERRRPQPIPTPPTGAEARGRTRPTEERSRSRGGSFSYRSQSAQRPTPESIRRTIEASLDESDSDFNAEWGRFTEAFKLGSYSTKNQSRTRVNFKYQTPASMFKEAWELYETKWTQLSSAQLPGGHSTTSTPQPTQLGFSDIPWPVLHQPNRVGDVATHLTESHISSFILSPFHTTSPNSSPSPNTESRARKMRIREALLRWHPDKMARILTAIENEDERRAVKEGADTVARHLTSMSSSS